MATTTNYSWTTPDDTALVKDGAAAIRTLGSSVDTTTKALNPSTTLGDIEYRSSTANTNTRLGIGSTGNVLTVAGGVPSWVAPTTPASGLTFITSASPSAVSTISINNCFSATYRNYLIIYNLEFNTGGGVNLTLRYRASSTDNTSSNYSQNMLYLSSSTGTIGNEFNSAATFTRIAEIRDGGESTGTINVFSPQATARTTYTAAGASSFSTNSVGSFAAGSLTVTTAYDGFTLFTGSGAFTGTIRVYGVSNS